MTANRKDYIEPYNAGSAISEFKDIQERTEKNQRELSEILRRDPSSENFIGVYSIVESLHIKEGGGKKLFKTDYTGNPYIDYICKNMKPASNILEVGCGDGQLANILAEKGHNVVGIDSAQGCIELAIKDRDSNIRSSECDFEVFDCRNLRDLKSEYFDYVISNHLIEHIGLSGAISHLEHVSRILKKEGKYFITCPSALRSADEGDLHLKIYYYYELAQIAKMLKFDIQLISNLKGMLYTTLPSWANPLISAYEKILCLTGLNLVFNYFDINFPCIPMSVVLTKRIGNAERIRRRENITAMQRQGWYR